MTLIKKVRLLNDTYVNWSFNLEHYKSRYEQLQEIENIKYKLFFKKEPNGSIQ